MICLHSRKTAIRHVTKPGANLFRELGFAPDEARRLHAASRKQINDTRLLKRQLMEELSNWIVEHHLKQAEAAEILMVSRPRVSDVVNKKTSKFTIDTLVEMLSRVGKPVRLAIGLRDNNQPSSHSYCNGSAFVLDENPTLISVVTNKGQVTLPKAIRDRLGIDPGTRIEIEIQGDDTLKVRVLKRGSDGLFGLLQRPGEAARTLDDIDSGIAAAVTERAKRKR